MLNIVIDSWMGKLCASLSVIALVGGCAPKADDSNSGTLAFGGVGVPPLIRSGVQPDGTVMQPDGTVVRPDGTVVPLSFGLTPEEDIIFTDPDNPEASLPELSAILAKNAGKKGPWQQSITIARRLSVRSSKPMLIWFTDSDRSPMCKVLNRELFSTKEFEKWADENLIRLKVDSSADLSDLGLSLGQELTMRTEMRTYVIRLKKKYRIMGTPSLILLSPSGAVMGRYRGYQKGQSDFTWGLIKQGVVSSKHADKSWRKDLEARGYREWNDHKGRRVFAKLTRYQNGTLTLTEPDGTRSSTEESRLSAADQRWIQEQKDQRGIE